MKHLIPTIMAALALITATDAAAKPAKRGVFTITQPDGTTIEAQSFGDAFNHVTIDAQGRELMECSDGFWRPATEEYKAQREAALKRRMAMATETDETDNAGGTLPQSGLGLYSHKFPHEGSPRTIVILVSYKDVDFTLDNAHDYFNNMLNQPGFSEWGGTGSVIDYFTQNSMGVFTPQFDVYGPIELPYIRSYYGQNKYGYDARAEEMVIHAAQLLDDEVDFSQYDTDGDGYVDNVYVYYAGEGEASHTDQTNLVWPHQSTLQPTYAASECTFDGVIINNYACSNEYEATRPDGIGTFVHEFSHVLGLPDLYCTDYGEAEFLTPATYDALDYGPYNNNGCTPPAYSAYERNAFGWIDPIVIDHTMDVTLEEIQSSNTCYLIPTEKDTEFFLLENRQKITGTWDKYIPSHGMLVWHIDYVKSVFEQNRVNNKASHQYVDLIEAGGYAYSQSATILLQYPFPGSKKKTTLGYGTTPSLESWAGKDLSVTITDIKETDGVITFHAETPFSAVNDIELTAGETPAAYYNLQGARIASPKPGNVYIKVADGKATKVRY